MSEPVYKVKDFGHLIVSATTIDGTTIKCRLSKHGTLPIAGNNSKVTISDEGHLLFSGTPLTDFTVLYDDRKSHEVPADNYKMDVLPPEATGAIVGKEVYRVVRCDPPKSNRMTVLENDQHQWVNMPVSSIDSWLMDDTENYQRHGIEFDAFGYGNVSTSRGHRHTLDSELSVTVYPNGTGVIHISDGSTFINATLPIDSLREMASAIVDRANRMSCNLSQYDD